MKFKPSIPHHVTVVSHFMMFKISTCISLIANCTCLSMSIGHDYDMLMSPNKGETNSFLHVSTVHIRNKILDVSSPFFDLLHNSMASQLFHEKLDKDKLSLFFSNR